MVGFCIETNLRFDLQMVFKTQMAENLAKINIFHNHKNSKTNVKVTYWNWGDFGYQTHSCFIFWFNIHVWKNQTSFLGLIMQFSQAIESHLKSCNLFNKIQNLKMSIASSVVNMTKWYLVHSTPIICCIIFLQSSYMFIIHYHLYELLLMHTLHPYVY